MPRKKTATDEAIFQSTIEQVRRFGIRCSTTDIAHGAGLAGGPAIFMRFETKAALMLAVFEYSRISAEECEVLTSVPPGAEPSVLVDAIFSVIASWKSRDLGEDARPYVTSDMRRAYIDDVVFAIAAALKKRRQQLPTNDFDLLARVIFGAIYHSESFEQSDEIKSRKQQERLPFLSSLLN